MCINHTKELKAAPNPAFTLPAAALDSNTVLIDSGAELTIHIHDCKGHGGDRINHHLTVHVPRCFLKQVALKHSPFPQIFPGTHRL